MAHFSEHLSTILLDHSCGVAFERVAEGIVGGQEEPRIPAGLYNRFSRPVREGPGVVGPVDRVGGAFRAGQVRGRRTRHKKYFVLVAHDFVHCERHRGGRHVDDHVDLIDVNPGPRDVRADVRLVLMVGADDFDLHAFGGRAKILDRHPCCDDRALPAQIGIGPGHVVHHADLDCSVRILSLRRAAPECDGERRQSDQPFHMVPSCW